MIRATGTRTARAIGAAPAAPAGGARHAWRGRGCGLVLGVFLAQSGLAQAERTADEPPSLPVPSGQDVFLSEVLIDNTPGEIWVRFRFLAPRIGSDAGKVGYDVSAIDMDHLCQSLAVPYLSRHDLDPARVVISLSDRAVTFGASDPEATQFFEAYRLEGERCIWEGF
ncbi:DUF6497 family protein [Seohaeicola saemankumensis]|nr:DUF6497 family protein [Seohaeicola saemankumensis]MCA0869337.1 DUF6497 family protein [Seohaeicola saemankumensis]